MPELISILENNKHDAERWTSRVLRLGVWVSASLMIIGLLIAAIQPSTVTTFYTNPSLSDIFQRMFSGTFDPVTLMFTGLISLMFTPILRVITAVFGFAKEQDWRFVLVSSIVLLLLVGEIVYSVLVRG
jgi:uncharacterized membrane protein